MVITGQYHFCIMHPYHPHTRIIKTDPPRRPSRNPTKIRPSPSIATFFSSSEINQRKNKGFLFSSSTTTSNPTSCTKSFQGLIFYNRHRTVTFTKTIGSSPEPFNGFLMKAEALLTSLASYFFINKETYNSANKKITSALSYFKIGTPADEWAKDKQITALPLSSSNFGMWEAFCNDFKSHFIPIDTILLSIQQMHFMKIGNHSFFNWYQE